MIELFQSILTIDLLGAVGIGLDLIVASLVSICPACGVAGVGLDLLVT